MVNASFKDLGELIAEDLRTSTSTRRSLGGGGTAFGFLEGLPPSIADYVSTAESDGTNVPLTITSESGTPVSAVPEGTNKPLAVQISADTLALDTFAGYAEFTTQQALNADGIARACVSVLAAGALNAYELDAMAVLTADAGSSVTAGDWLAAIHAGQGGVLAAGGRPSVVVISAADYGVVMGALAGAAGYAADPESPIGAIAGSQIHVSSQLGTGVGFVLDKAAVLSVQHKDSPLLSVDSSGIQNKTRLVADLVAGTAVTSAPHVVQIGLTVQASNRP